MQIAGAHEISPCPKNVQKPAKLGVLAASSAQIAVMVQEDQICCSRSGAKLAGCDRSLTRNSLLFRVTVPLESGNYRQNSLTSRFSWQEEGQERMPKEDMRYTG